MSLFTAISSLFQLGVVAHGSFDDARIKTESKSRAINNGKHTYMDSHGQEYDVRTGKRIYMTVNNGNKVLRDAQSNSIVYNITNEENNNRKNDNREKAIIEGKRFYFDPIKKLYCEISTGKYYSRGNGFWGSYGDPYWDVDNCDRYVYEYNEGPTDEEMMERDSLFSNYMRIKKDYENIKFIDYLDYTDNMDEYHKKIMSKNMLMHKMNLAKSKLTAFDSKMKNKYERM